MKGEGRGTNRPCKRLKVQIFLTVVTVVPLIAINYEYELIIIIAYHSVGQEYLYHDNICHGFIIACSRLIITS